MIWGKLSYNMGRVVLDYGASCLSSSFNWSELSWGKLSLVRVVRNSSPDIFTDFVIFKETFLIA